MLWNSIMMVTHLCTWQRWMATLQHLFTVAQRMDRLLFIWLWDTATMKLSYTWCMFTVIPISSTAQINMVTPSSILQSLEVTIRWEMKMKPVIVDSCDITTACGEVMSTWHIKALKFCRRIHHQMRNEKDICCIIHSWEIRTAYGAVMSRWNIWSNKIVQIHIYNFSWIASNRQWSVPCHVYGLCVFLCMLWSILL